MSFDIDLCIDTGAEHLTMIVDVVNGVTYNLAPMFFRALGTEKGLRGLDGQLAGACIAPLEAAVSDMRHPDNVANYRALQPENGWGDYDGAVSTLERLLTACREHPRCVVRIS